MYTSSTKKFEDSPQCKLNYKIEEDLSKVVHVYGVSVNEFDTIVKVDKKTEEKLNQRDETKSSAKKKRSALKQKIQTTSPILEKPEEPLN